MIPETVCRLLDEKVVNYEKNISLRDRSTFRVGGVGELGIFPKSADELVAALGVVMDSGVKFYVIGRGSNILFGDGDVEGAFIFTEGLSGLRVEGETIIADAGVSLASLAGKAAKNGLTGLEFARGIPGTVGGALYMNAGAYDGCIANVTSESYAFDCETRSIVTIKEHEFGYRESIYMKNKSLICLGAKLCLTVGDKEKIEEKMSDFAEKRKEKQPLNFPSAGSYFKRPEGHFAGKLIEDAGLKGYTVGGASVSEKHAGFIINLGGATASDVLSLEEEVRSTVLRRFGVTLEREVRVIK